MLFEIDPGLMPAGYGESILSLVAAKAHLRVVEDDDDDLIAALRDSAVDMVERYCSLYLARRTGLVWTGSGFSGRMHLGRGPDAVVDSVAYTGPSGSVALTTADWRLSVGSRLLPAFGGAWPADCRGAVTVTFSAGYEDVERQAPSLIAAVKMALTQLYDLRSAVVTGTIINELPFGVRAICDAVRMPVL